LAQLGQNRARSDPTRPDPTRPDPTRPDPTRPTGGCRAVRAPSAERVEEPLLCSGRETVSDLR
jgi:hypothetical protein